MKKIFVLFAAALLLTGCSGGCADDAVHGQQASSVQESALQETGSDDTSGNENVTNNNVSEEQEAVILENEGDVEIIVPDGLESAGE